MELTITIVLLVGVVLLALGMAGKTHLKRRRIPGTRKASWMGMELDMQVNMFDYKELEACEAFAESHPNGHIVDSQDDQYIYVHAKRPISLAQAQACFDDVALRA